jgi:hypothetical protein
MAGLRVEEVVRLQQVRREEGGLLRLVVLGHASSTKGYLFSWSTSEHEAVVSATFHERFTRRIRVQVRTYLLYKVRFQTSRRRSCERISHYTHICNRW